MYALLSDYTNLGKSCTGIYGKVFLLLIVFASQSFYAEGVLVFATELQIGFFWFWFWDLSRSWSNWFPKSGKKTS